MMPDGEKAIALPQKANQIQSVSFVPSIRPKEDAVAILRISPGRFVVSEESERSVTLISSSSDGCMEAEGRDASEAIVLLNLGDQQHQEQHHQQQHHSSAVPNATVILEESQLASIQSATTNVDTDGFVVKSSSEN